MADQLTVQVHEQGLGGHKAAFRPDEAGLLYATANSAHNELLRDRTELRQLTQELDATNVNAPDHDEKLNKAIDLLTHMDYTAGLHGHASERITEVLAHDQEKADYEGSIRQRIAGLFDNLKDRLFGSGDDGSSHPTGPWALPQRPAAPARRCPTPQLPQRRPLRRELVPGRAHRAGLRPGQRPGPRQGRRREHAGPLGDDEEHPRRRRFLAGRRLRQRQPGPGRPPGPRRRRVHGLRPQFSVTAQNTDQRADELMSDTYRENIKLLYSEPEGTSGSPGTATRTACSPSTRSTAPSTPPSTTCGTSTSSTSPTRTGIKGLIDWTDDLYEKERKPSTTSPTSRECPENLLEYNVLVPAGLEETASHPDRDSLEKRNDEPGLLFHTGVLAGIQYDRASEELQSIVGTIIDPATEADARLDAWEDATSTMAKLDYLRSLQEHINEQIDDHLAQERAAQEEARNRSIMGRIRSLFAAQTPVEEAVA